MTGKAPLLLTAAVAAGKKKVDSGYDVAAIARLVFLTKTLFVHIFCEIYSY